MTIERDNISEVDPGQWRAAGERIESLLDASSAGGAVARERAEQLVREVSDLYGAGLERIIEIAASRSHSLVEELARDDLVASLMLVHGLHPHDVETRVRTALDSVRPYLGSHGGDVELIAVDDGVVQLRLTGSCKTCPSSSVTLELAVKDAVQAAAPETTDIVVIATEAPSTAGMISADSLMSHVHSAPHAMGSWIAVPELADLLPGEIGGFSVAGLPILACRLGDDLYAYRDRCPACTNSLAGAQLQRRFGGAIGDAVLRCPVCHAHYSVKSAGAALDNAESGATGDTHEGDHLDPLPVLVRDGVLSVAIPATEAAE